MTSDGRDMTRSSRFELFRAAPATALILAASGINFLLYHDYPLLTGEVALFAAILGLIVLVMSALYTIRSRLWRACLEATAIFIAVDLNLGSPLATNLATGGALVYLGLRGGTLLPLLTVMFGVAFLTSLAGLSETRMLLEEKQQQAEAPATDRPAVLHLILDEHIGIEGVPASNPEAVRIKDELKARYTSLGFRVYGGAYSEHLHTVNAIPHILSFGETADAKSTSHKGVVLNKNAYFEAMRNYGYEINIVQSDFAEICSSTTYAVCTTYWSDTLKLLRDYPLTTQERAYVMFFKFVSLSRGIQDLSALIDYAALASGRSPTAPLVLERRSRTSTVGALAAFDALNAHLLQAQPGELYFMHVLAPHYPYVAQSDCRLRPPAEWEVRRSSDRRQVQEAAYLQVRETAYLEQVRCVTLKVEAAVRALSQSSAKDNFVVIVHGDHGSRITKLDPREENLGRFDDADIVAGFSTLFAVRGPGVEPGYTSRPAPVALLLGQWVEGEFRAPPVAETDPGTARVYLDDWYWTLKSRHSLPRGWLNGLAEGD
jgi:hypothetical protein